MNCSNEEGMLSFVEHIELVKKANMSFDFTMLQDSSGKCTGHMWQTSMMSDNFEMIGHCIIIDPLKREINLLLWNHTGVDLLDKLVKSCI